MEEKIIKKKKNTAQILDNSEVIKVKVFNLNNETERAEYEFILNNPAFQIFRDEFMYDKSGNPKIAVWFYDRSK